ALNNTERAPSNAGAATIADIILDHDGAKFGTEQGTSRAHIQAASIGAVLADIRRHQPTESISIRRRGIGGGRIRGYIDRRSANRRHAQRDQLGTFFTRFGDALVVLLNKR